jgi:hypothetical protein
LKPVFIGSFLNCCKGCGSTSSGSEGGGEAPFCCQCPRFSCTDGFSAPGFPLTLTATITAGCIGTLTIPICREPGAVARCGPLVNNSLLETGCGTDCSGPNLFSPAKADYFGSQQGAFIDQTTVTDSCQPPFSFQTDGDVDWAFRCRLRCWPCPSGDVWLVSASPIKTFDGTPNRTHHQFFIEYQIPLLSCEPLIWELTGTVVCAFTNPIYLCEPCGVPGNCPPPGGCNDGFLENMCVANHVAYTADNYCPGSSFTLTITE